MTGLFGMVPPYTPPVRRKIFVSYHHANDQAYYNTFSKVFHDQYEAIQDNSLDREVDSDNTDYIMRRIRDNHINGSSCTVVLVGAQTPFRKYVDWEIKATLDASHGLVGLWLPTVTRNNAGQIIVPDRLHDNIMSGYAVWSSWAEIANGTVSLNSLIEDANSRDQRFINNTREKRLRNG